VIALGALALIGGWFLLRDSPLVSVDHVTVTGVDGADASAISSALRSAARKMTTLDVQTGQLRAAVSRFPEVKGLSVSTQLPHGIVIHVVEFLPVAVVEIGGRKVQVSGEGRLLPAAPATESLPLIPLPDPPVGVRLTQPWALAAVRLLGAAPYQLLPKVGEVTSIAGHGLVGQLHNGPSIYFGDATQAAAKWAAVLAVLADSNSQGASYIDVTDPQHPAAGSTAGTGSATGGNATTSAGTSGSAATSGGTGAGAGTSGTAAGASGASVPAAVGATAAAGSGGTTTPASPAGG
jgi:cell division septal protein FtsQ